MIDLELEALQRYVGSQIRQLREVKGWTLEDFAEESGVGAAYVGHIERGTSTPSLKTLVRLAETLEVSVGSLFPGGDSPSPTRRSRRNQLVQEIVALLEQADTRKLTLIAKLVKDVVET